MNDIYEVHEMPDGRELKIMLDHDPINPRTEWDCNIGVMVCQHSRYDLGDRHKHDLSECNSWCDVLTQIETDCKPVVILPLYLLDHSGITIRTTSFNDHWDSGQVGWIYTTKEILDKFGIEEQYRTVETLKQWLRKEVEQYDDYLTGNVYGYSVIRKEVCNLGCTHEIEEDSSWGYFGSDFVNNGLYEAAGYSTQCVVRPEGVL